MLRRTAFRTLLAILVLSAAAGSAALFGYNKVIIRTFDWRIRQTSHFDVHYYDKAGENLLPYAEKYLERAFDRVTSYLPANPAERMPFFLYNTHNEFEQTNITDIGEGTGGVTEAFKNRLVLSHGGSMRELEYLITHESTHEIEFDYLFSGFWKSVRLLKFIFYPNWLMEGLAEYSTGDIDATTREMYLRDASTCGQLLPLSQLHSFNHVLPHKVTLGYKESNAFMKYLAEEYGEDKLPRLLESYRNNFDADSVLYDVIGTDLSQLNKRFREYMEEKYSALSKGLSEPEAYGKAVTKASMYPSFDQNGVFFPDGRSIAYISDRRGNREIFRLDVENGRTELLYSMTGGGRIENINGSGAGLSISADGRYLVFCGEELQKDYIFIYDTVKKKIRRYAPGTDTAEGPEVSPDGGTVYFTGMQDGFSDLYSYSLGDGSLQRLTEGPYDDKDPAVSPDGKKLVYSAERVTISGRPEYDLVMLDLVSKQSAALTELAGDEKNASFSPDGAKVYFVSDQDGINDIYSIYTADKNVERLTRVVGGNFNPKPSRDGSKLIFSSFRRGEMRLYAADSASLEAGASRGAAKPSSVDRAQNGRFSADSSTGTAKRMKFRPGLDLFYPALFYSSLDGLYLATYWQASDMLGEHQAASLLQYASGAEYLDYTVSYGFLRYRTQFYFLFNGNEYFWDSERTIKRDENTQTVAALYPLNRFQRLEFLLSTTAKRERDKDLAGYDIKTRENIAGLAYMWDVTQGPYLEITSGWGFRVESELSDRVFGGNYRYENYALETWKYFPLGGEHAIGWRTFTGGSFDQDAGWFYLGGNNRVRGYPSNIDYAGRKIFINNLEWRFPIVKDLNYHMWYMFPDFFFKTFYGAIFADAGMSWNNDSELERMTLETWKGSYGFSLRFHTFILQQYPLLLNLQLARRMDGPTAVLYLSLGSTF